MIQLDLASPADGIFPEHWLAATMPQAQLYQHESALTAIATGPSIELSTALRERLTDSAKASQNTIIAVDKATAAPWRLRTLPAASGCWLVQSIAESRRNLLQDFRKTLAYKLASSQQHDLRNPLNALGLQCDLLSRTAKPDATHEALAQAAHRIAQMKDRLRDLLERQNSMVSLWLSDPHAEHPKIDLTAVTTEVLRLLRSYASQREVTIHVENLTTLDSSVVNLSSIPVRLVMIAAGVLAIESNVHGAGVAGDAQVSIEVFSDAGPHTNTPSLQLKMQSDWNTSALDPEMHFSDIDEWLHSLALLLDHDNVKISRPSPREICFGFEEAARK